MPEAKQACRKIPRVIFVHGTFACEEADEGSAWWQRGSEFFEALGHELDGVAALVSERPLFRWPDDANAESARTRAAQSLLSYLEEYERWGIPYHLVGHSHGGSVIWEALKISCRPPRGWRPWRRRRRFGPLQHLSSWTTVGTPFISKRVKLVPWLVRGALTLAALLVLAAALAIAFFLLLFAAYGDFTLSYYWLVPVGGWLAFVVLAGSVSAFDDGRQLRRERSAASRACDAHGRKWLGVWSRDDEALNGLAAANRLTLALVGSRPLERSPFVGRLWWWTTYPARWLTHRLKRLVAPAVDAFVAGLLKRKALGDDRPAPKSHSVAPSPFPLDGGDLQGLDEASTRRLREAADESLKGDIAGLRKLLRTLATTPDSSVEEIAKRSGIALSGLVHTSYFSDCGVRQLIVAHIASAERADAILAHLPAGSLKQVALQNEVVERWLRDHRARRPSWLMRKVLSIPLWAILLVASVVGIVILGIFISQAIYVIVDAINAAFEPIE